MKWFMKTVGGILIVFCCMFLGVAGFFVFKAVNIIFSGLAMILIMVIGVWIGIKLITKEETDEAHRGNEEGQAEQGKNR